MFVSFSSPLGLFPPSLSPISMQVEIWRDLWPHIDIDRSHLNLFCIPLITIAFTKFGLDRSKFKFDLTFHLMTFDGLVRSNNCKLSLPGTHTTTVTDARRGTYHLRENRRTDRQTHTYIFLGKGYSHRHGANKEYFSVIYTVTVWIRILFLLFTLWRCE